MWRAFKSTVLFTGCVATLAFVPLVNLIDLPKKVCLFYLSVTSRRSFPFGFLQKFERHARISFQDFVFGVSSGNASSEMFPSEECR